MNNYKDLKKLGISNNLPELAPLMRVERTILLSKISITISIISIIISLFVIFLK